MRLKDPIWDENDKTISVQLEEGDEIPEKYSVVEAVNGTAKEEFTLGDIIYNKYGIVTYKILSRGKGED